MPFSRATTFALASVGGAVGAIAANGPPVRRKFLSRERAVGSMLGFSAGLALGFLGEAAQPASLGALELTDTSTTPLKFRPIQIVRADAVATPLRPDGIQPFNAAVLRPLPDRLLITY